MIDEAHVMKTAGLDTPARRLKYFQLLDSACERGHEASACIEAAVAAPSSARSLLFHGCSIGDASACQALIQVERALALGCATFSGAPCDLREDLDAAMLHASVVVFGDTDPYMEEAQRAHRLLLGWQECRDACPMLQDECRQRCMDAARESGS